MSCPSKLWPPIPCGQSLLTFMHAIPDIDGVDALRISEITINGIPITIAVIGIFSDLSPDTVGSADR